MRGAFWMCACAAVLVVGCGGDDYVATPSDTTTATGSGSTSTGTAAGGTGGTGGAGGMGATGGGGGGGATGGAPSCPGTEAGCVNDFAGQFGVPGNADGIGSAAQFTNPSDIAGDGTHLYVTANNAVRRIEIASANVETWAGSSGASGHVDAQGTNARFGGVAGIVSDGTSVWVVDSSNHCIREIDIAGVNVGTLAGSPGNPGLQDGTGSAALFSGPRGITHDGTYLYVIEHGNHALRRIDPTSGAVLTIAGGNGPGTADGDGQSTAQFDTPRYVWAVGAGDLYVGDTENHRVRHVVVTNETTGASTVSTTWGSTAGHADGDPGTAQFDRLRGIGYDGALLLIADSDNYVIRTAAIGGDVSTIAGQAGVATHAVDTYLAAGFDKPLHVYYEPTSGDLFITENSVIRRMIYP